MKAKKIKVARKWADYPAFLAVAMVAGFVSFVFSGTRGTAVSRHGFEQPSDSFSTVEWRSGLGIGHIFPVREFFPYRPDKRQH